VRTLNVLFRIGPAGSGDISTACCITAVPGALSPERTRTLHAGTRITTAGKHAVPEAECNTTLPSCNTTEPSCDITMADCITAEAPCDITEADCNVHIAEHITTVPSYITAVATVGRQIAMVVMCAATVVP
jgi:hypothetical protein